MPNKCVSNENISRGAYEEKKEAINKEAQNRFLSLQPLKNKRTVPSERNLETMFISRTRNVDEYDGIAIERILGKSDLFPIFYLQSGLEAGDSICRISIRNNAGSIIGYGTGFLVSPSVLMTNNHVLDCQNTALNALVEFNYQDDKNFMPCPSHAYRLDPKKFFFTSEKLDFTLVAVKDNVNQEKSIRDFGYLSLIPETGKIIEGEYVSIIQHPKGGPKAVTLRENQVRSIHGDFIHYLTDTEPGSSGSPVFNDQWVVVALHHAGVPDPNKRNEWVANEGIRISSISQEISKAYPSFNENAKKYINEIFPDLAKNNTEEIPPAPSGLHKGYNPFFLGDSYHVSLPKLSLEMEKNTTKQADGNNVLDYVHFSIVMCKSRGLAYYTAVNIDGKKQVKIDRKDKDKWEYDPRISHEFQYGNEVYSNNDLDRGHLVRRQDPNWGTKADANQANKDTFHYTNSAPQHKNLNQKTWLELEDYILKNANTHGLKVSVFTGPVFRADDRTYRKKYKIPAEFWKVVVMVKNDGELSATAYIQTQKNMISDLEFAYGEYKTYQIPITSVENITGLNFGELRNYDPIANIESTGLLIEGAEDLKL